MFSPLEPSRTSIPPFSAGSSQPCLITRMFPTPLAPAATQDEISRFISTWIKHKKQQSNIKQTSRGGWKQIQHSNTLVETGKQLCRRSELPLPPLALPFFHAHASIREVSHNWGPQHSISQHHEWDSAIHGISSYENEEMTIDHDTCKLKWFGHTSVGGWATSLYERQWRSSSQVGWKIDIHFKHVQTCSNHEPVFEAT